MGIGKCWYVLHMRHVCIRVLCELLPLLCVTAVCMPLQQLHCRAQASPTSFNTHMLISSCRVPRYGALLCDAQSEVQAQYIDTVAST
jgi:hypothetical protein